MPEIADKIERERFIDDLMKKLRPHIREMAAITVAAMRDTTQEATNA